MGVERTQRISRADAQQKSLSRRAVGADHSPLISHVERTNRAFHEEVQRLLRVTRCNVEMYSTKAKIRRRTIASFHSFDTKSRDSLLVISCI